MLDPPQGSTETSCPSRPKYQSCGKRRLRRDPLRHARSRVGVGMAGPAAALRLLALRAAIAAAVEAPRNRRRLGGAGGCRGRRRNVGRAVRLPVARCRLASLPRPPECHTSFVGFSLSSACEFRTLRIFAPPDFGGGRFGAESLQPHVPVRVSAGGGRKGAPLSLARAPLHRSFSHEVGLERGRRGV